MALDPQQSLEMFGCNIDHFVRSVITSPAYDRTGLPMVLMSHLSDVQEMIELGMNEEARQSLNRVKYLLGNIENPEMIQLKFD